MANYIIDGTLLTNIAAAIRSKKAVSNSYTPAQMASAINGLSVGATEVTALDVSYGSNEKRIPAQGSVDISLTNAIDSIRNVRFTTYNSEHGNYEPAIGGVTLLNSTTIRVWGGRSEAAYLHTLKVYGYTHKVQ